MKSTILILCIALFSLTLSAQEYFQQRVDHRIHVELDDSRHVLTGHDTITYYNNSPEELNEIYIHVWPNSYVPNSPMDAQLLENGSSRLHYSDQEHQSELNGLVIKAAEKNIRWNYIDEAKEIIKLELNKPIKTGEKQVITIMFRLKIPAYGISRLQHDRQAYFLSQWFPQPAVYDKNGWHYFSNLDQGEYYSEFGNYDVFLKLPDNYLVASSGVVVDNPDEEEFILDEDKKTRKIKRFSNRETNFTASGRKTKTLHLQAKNVHDFSICADKRFHVFKDSLISPSSGKKIDIRIMFTGLEGSHWANTPEFVKSVLEMYIEEIGDYPYDHLDIVQTPVTTGSKEYPALIQIGTMGEEIFLQQELTRCIGKMWFYGAIGINEREFPWMDESLSSMYELLFKMNMADSISIQDILTDPGVTADYINLDQYSYWYADYLLMLYRDDMPAQAGDIAAEKYSREEYLNVLKTKNAMSLLYLRDYLGEEVFREIMHAYYNTWEHKHPYPDDFRSIAEEVSGKDLGWWFNILLAKAEMPDLKIKKVKQNENEYQILIKNYSEHNIPIAITAIGDSTEQKVWFEGSATDFTVTFPETDFKVRSFVLDKDNLLPEPNRKDNQVKTKGLFKRTEKLAFEFLAGLPLQNRTQIQLSPVIGYNKYDGLMLGSAFYSNPFITPKNEYLIMPMWGFKSEEPAGTVEYIHHFNPKSNRFESIDLKLDYQQYNYQTLDLLNNGYKRFSPELIFKFEKKQPRDTHSKQLRLRSVIVNKDVAQWHQQQDMYVQGQESYYINEATFTIRDKRILYPYKASLILQQGNEMLKMMFDGNYFINYRSRGQGLRIRAFAGAFIIKPDNPGGYTDFRLKMSGTNGFDDYMYDQIFPFRSETNGLGFSQFIANEGGFKSFTYLGKSWDWLATTSVNSTIPGITVIELYADFGTSAALKQNKGGYTVLYDMGVQVNIIKDVFMIYLPLLESKDISDNNDLNKVYDNYWQRIRFTIDLAKLNPLKLPKKIEF